MQTVVRKRAAVPALGYVNMEPMTDAFLTASVLAAVAASEPLVDRVLDDGSKKTTTRMIGIANQRVKECNRIRAMIDQLGAYFTCCMTLANIPYQSQVWSRNEGAR